MKVNQFRYQEVLCYTLQDVVELFKGSEYDLYKEAFTFDTLISRTGFQTSLLPIYELDNLQYVIKDYIEELWSFVYPKFREHYCMFLTEEITKPEATKFMIDIVRRINETYPKYATLLKHYQSKANTLLDKVNTASVDSVRYNDTPQNSGTFDDDEHTTNLTESNSTTGTDAMTPMSRLKEIQEAYKNVMLDWCNEFGKFFLEGANIL